MMQKMVSSMPILMLETCWLVLTVVCVTSILVSAFVITINVLVCVVESPFC